MAIGSIPGRLVSCCCFVSSQAVPCLPFWLLFVSTVVSGMMSLNSREGVVSILPVSYGDQYLVHVDVYA